MRRITKDEAPEFWTAYIRKNPRTTYQMLEETQEGRTVKSQIRAHMVQHQQHLCGYCCKVIEAKNAHNEHICPKSTYQKESMEYNNLIASCITQGGDATCGMKKGGDYNTVLFVSPLMADCERHFRFLENGMIDGITPEGRYTVELLNLNSYALKAARFALLKEIDQTAKDCGKEYIVEYYVAPSNGYLPRFVDMVEYFMRTGRFETDAECLMGT